MTGEKSLRAFVAAYSYRGECKCGRCIDVGNKPDPTEHTVDMIMFKVAAIGSPSRDEFIELSRAHKGEFADCDVFDKKEHSYIELGGWIGDQGLALQYMGLGVALGVFQLLSPKTMMPGMLPDELVMQMAQNGLVTVQAL